MVKHSVRRWKCEFTHVSHNVNGTPEQWVSDWGEGVETNQQDRSTVDKNKGLYSLNKKLYYEATVRKERHFPS